MPVALPSIGPVRELMAIRQSARAQVGEILHTDADHSAIGASITPSDSGLDAASLSTAIIESCSEAIVPTSLDGDIIGWNAAATELLGYTADEMIGQLWRDLVPADCAQDIPRAAQLV